MSRKMNPHVAFCPSSSQRLWDFLSPANIWLSWKRVILSMRSVFPVSWATQSRCPDLTEPLQVLAPILWPRSLPVSSSRPGWMCSRLTGKHHILTVVPSTPWGDFHCVFLLFLPILTPDSFSLVYTWSERVLITQCWLQSFSWVSVRLSSHCVCLSQSSTSWIVPSGVKI